MYSLINKTDAAVLSLVLMVGMVAMTIAGRIISRRWSKEDTEPKGGVNSLFTALFALSGLILAFTFGMSQNRLEKVRDIVEEEANDIGTAVLRSDLYADSIRNGFRADFKNYLEAVIVYYENATNIDSIVASKNHAQTAATRLWARAAQQAKMPNMLIPSNQMIPALNTMFDVATSREVILKSKIPDLIIVMLFVCVLASCFVGGFTSSSFSHKDWVIIAGFALITSMVAYTTIDLARPMRGIIQESAGQDAIIELRNMFSK